MGIRRYRTASDYQTLLLARHDQGDAVDEIAARALRVGFGRLGHFAVSFSERAAALGQDELLRTEGELAPTPWCVAP